MICAVELNTLATIIYVVQRFR